MHIYFTLKPDSFLEIPVHYNHLIQGAVYNAIEPELAAFLHKKGYESGNRKFKLFAFSRLIGRFQINKEKKTIRFMEEIKLVISSPVDEFCQSIANGMLTKGSIRFGNGDVEVEKMLVRQFKVERERVVLRTLSPVVVYSTFLRPDGRKYTCYFQPGEPDYDVLVGNNLRKKYQAFYGIEAPPGEVKVRKLGQIRLHILDYKGTVIKGCSGKLVTTGPKELLQMAVDAGIGSKNGQGFGCVEVGGR
ncbi:MAG: CRISPR-associated protein Cas6 [Peptococcaceae bacterium BRH_c4a]|nr:MAG: CRISPR-associated protein Cas6 [Peptococcaceae bacterium BRH_c4a]